LAADERPELGQRSRHAGGGRGRRVQLPEQPLELLRGRGVLGEVHHALKGAKGQRDGAGDLGACG
jgi:hypothetical protein